MFSCFSGTTTIHVFIGLGGISYQGIQRWGYSGNSRKKQQRNSQNGVLLLLLVDAK